MPDQNGIYDFSGFTKRENDDEPLFTPLPTIMEQASQQSPQEFARSLTLSQQTGIPAEAVRSNIPAVESVAKAQQYDFSGLVKRSPATGQFLNDYNNAVLSQNDVPVLERIERLWHSYNSMLGSLVEGTKESLSGVGSSISLSYQQQGLGVLLAGTDRLSEGLDQLIPSSSLPAFVSPEQAATRS